MIARNVLWFEAVYRLERELQTPDDKVEPRIPISIVTVSSDVDLKRDVKEKVAKIRGDYGVSQFRERLERGDILFCAYSKENFVGFIWLMSSSVVVESGYKLQDGEAYHIDGWTFEPYRGNRVLSVLQQSIANYLIEERPDVRLLVGHAAIGNKASLAGYRRAGFVIVARELSVTLLGHNRKFRCSGEDLNP